MKLTRLIALPLAVLMLLTLVSCKPSKPIHDPALDEGYNGPGTSPDVKPITDPSEVVTVYFDVSGRESDLIYMTQLVQQKGFALEFKIFFGDLTGANLAKAVGPGDSIGSTKEHAVYLTFTSVAYALLEKTTPGDFFGMLSGVSREYLDRAMAINPEGHMYFMPLDVWGYAARPAVLIRNDIYEEYGREIRSASDYEGLLWWLKKRNPDKVPGISGMLAFDELLGPRYGWTPLNLFLPGIGYTLLNELLVFSNWYSFWVGEDGSAQGFYEMDAAVDAMQEFYYWRMDGLIDVWTEDMGEVFDNYPTILVNSDMKFAGASDETRRFFNRVTDMAYAGDIDYTQYTINIFSEPKINTPPSFYVAVAAQETDISEFLRFMEWLEDIENYKYFIYGVEGVDFVIDIPPTKPKPAAPSNTAPAGPPDSEQTSPSETEHIDLSGYLNSNLKIFFNRYDYEWLIGKYSKNMPVNYAEEMSGLYPTAPVLPFYTRKEIYTQMEKVSNVYWSTLYDKMTELERALYGKDPPLYPRELIDQAFEEMRQARDSDLLAKLYNEALGSR